MGPRQMGPGQMGPRQIGPGKISSGQMESHVITKSKPLILYFSKEQWNGPKTTGKNINTTGLVTACAMAMFSIFAWCGNNFSVFPSFPTCSQDLALQYVMGHWIAPSYRISENGLAVPNHIKTQS